MQTRRELLTLYLMFISLLFITSNSSLLTDYLAGEMRYKGWVEVREGEGSCEGTEKSEDGDER